MDLFKRGNQLLSTIFGSKAVHPHGGIRLKGVEEELLIMREVEKFHAAQPRTKAGPLLPSSRRDGSRGCDLHLESGSHQPYFRVERFRGPISEIGACENRVRS